MSSIKSILTGNLMASIAFAATDMGSFSLADLANMDTTEVQELSSRLFPAGLFDVRCTSVTLGMNDAKEGINEKTGREYDPVPYVDFKYEILAAQPLDKSVDADSLVTRTLSDRVTLWPDQLMEEIGYLKGNYAKIGLPNAGVFGGMEGGEPGWLDGAVDHIFPIKVTHSKPNSEGIQRTRINWQKNPNAEAA